MCETADRGEIDVGADTGDRDRRRHNIAVGIPDEVVGDAVRVLAQSVEIGEDVVSVAVGLSVNREDDFQVVAGRQQQLGASERRFALVDISAVDVLGEAGADAVDTGEAEGGLVIDNPGD